MHAFVFICVLYMVYVHTHRSGTDVSVLLYIICLILLRRGLSLNLKLTILARLAGLYAPRIHWFLWPNVGVIGMQGWSCLVFM